MIPAALVAMESLPVTINGQLDKRALPEPAFGVDEVYVAPATDMEIAVCRIWEELLELERVGMTDDFFRIGGNSILAIQVAHRMSKLLGCAVNVADIFEYPTPSSLLEHNIGEAQVSIPMTAGHQAVLSFA